MIVDQFQVPVTVDDDALPAAKPRTRRQRENSALAELFRAAGASDDKPAAGNSASPERDAWPGSGITQ
jgi:hypothetical protein